MWPTENRDLKALVAVYTVLTDAGLKCQEGKKKHYST